MWDLLTLSFDSYSHLVNQGGGSIFISHLAEEKIEAQRDIQRHIQPAPRLLTCDPVRLLLAMLLYSLFS